MFLRMPILTYVARQELPKVPLPNDENKDMYTGHSLPDLYLQNTCKFAVRSALVWRPIAKLLPCSPQDMLLHSQMLLKKCRMLPHCSTRGNSGTLTKRVQNTTIKVCA